MDEYLYEGLKTKDAQAFLVSIGIPKKNQPKSMNDLASLYDCAKRFQKQQNGEQR